MKKVGQKIEGQNLKFMIVRFLLLFSTALVIFFNMALAVPQTIQRPSEDLSSILKKLKIEINDLKYEIHNHESEIRKFENRLQGQEASFENSRESLKDDFEILKDSFKSIHINLEGRIVKLEQFTDHLTKTSSAFSEDLRGLKSHADETTLLLGQYMQKVSELEKSVQVQKQETHHLQIALQTMMEALELKTTFSVQASGTYKVQAGDTLEKIAKNHKVSLQELREANNLKGDKIFVGQNLKIP